MATTTSTTTTTTTMKEAHVQHDTSVTLHDVPLPRITDPHQLIIRVVVAGCNPKDWKMPAGQLVTISDCPNSGDDIAGYVHAVGDAVQGFSVNDRVAALHQLGAPYGAYAEFALVWDHASFHIPPELPFEAAATLPMGSLMAALGLFGLLKATDSPWAPLAEARPLLIYGASGTVGAYVVKLAAAAGIHPLICVAGKGGAFVKGLVEPSKGDVVIDYRGGAESLLEQVRAALDGRPLQYAFDAVCERGSWTTICKVLDPTFGNITLALPFHQSDIPSHFRQTLTMVGSLWPGFHRAKTHTNLGLDDGGPDFGAVMTTLIGRWFAAGKLKHHPYEVVPGGLGGLEEALKNLRSGKNSATKYVIRINETPGLES